MSIFFSLSYIFSGVWQLIFLLIQKALMNALFSCQLFCIFISYFIVYTSIEVFLCVSIFLKLKIMNFFMSLKIFTIINLVLPRFIKNQYHYFPFYIIAKKTASFFYDLLFYRYPQTELRRNNQSAQQKVTYQSRLFSFQGSYERLWFFLLPLTYIKNSFFNLIT